MRIFLTICCLTLFLHFGELRVKRKTKNLALKYHHPWKDKRSIWKRFDIKDKYGTHFNKGININTKNVDKKGVKGRFKRLPSANILNNVGYTSKVPTYNEKTNAIANIIKYAGGSLLPVMNNGRIIPLVSNNVPYTKTQPIVPINTVRPNGVSNIYGNNAPFYNNKNGQSSDYINKMPANVLLKEPIGVNKDVSYLNTRVPITQDKGRDLQQMNNANQFLTPSNTQNYHSNTDNRFLPRQLNFKGNDKSYTLLHGYGNISPRELVIPVNEKDMTNPINNVKQLYKSQLPAMNNQEVGIIVNTNNKGFFPSTHLKSLESLNKKNQKSVPNIFQAPFSPDKNLQEELIVNSPQELVRNLNENDIKKLENKDPLSGVPYSAGQSDLPVYYSKSVDQGNAENNKQQPHMIFLRTYIKNDEKLNNQADGGTDKKYYIQGNNGIYYPLKSVESPSEYYSNPMTVNNYDASSDKYTKANTSGRVPFSILRLVPEAGRTNQQLINSDNIPLTQSIALATDGNSDTPIYLNNSYVLQQDPRNHGYLGQNNLMLVVNTKGNSKIQSGSNEDRNSKRMFFKKLNEKGNDNMENLELDELSMDRHTPGVYTSSSLRRSSDAGYNDNEFDRSEPDSFLNRINNDLLDRKLRLKHLKEHDNDDRAIENNQENEVENGREKNYKKMNAHFNDHDSDSEMYENVQNRQVSASPYMYESSNNVNYLTTYGSSYLFSTSTVSSAVNTPSAYTYSGFNVKASTYAPILSKNSTTCAPNITKTDFDFGTKLDVNNITKGSNIKIPNIKEKINFDIDLKEKLMNACPFGKNDSQFLKNIANDSELLGTIIREIEAMKNASFKNAKEGAPCKLRGTWDSTAAGVQFNFDVKDTINDRDIDGGSCEMHINVTDRVPPMIGLVNANWTVISGTAPFKYGGPFSMVLADKQTKSIASFIGQCRVCGGIDEIVGWWLIGKKARDCNELPTTGEFHTDVLHRDSLHFLRKDKIQSIETLKALQCPMKNDE